jgi:hypothetical protein
MGTFLRVLMSSWNHLKYEPHGMRLAVVTFVCCHLLECFIPFNQLELKAGEAC